MHYFTLPVLGAFLLSSGEGLNAERRKPIVFVVGDADNLPDSLIENVYRKYRSAAVDSDYALNAFRRRYDKNDKEFRAKIKKLEDVHAVKHHNVEAIKNKDLDQLVYINNPLESKVPRAVLTLQEFKAALRNRYEIPDKENKTKITIKAVALRNSNIKPTTKKTPRQPTTKPPTRTTEHHKIGKVTTNAKHSLRAGTFVPTRSNDRGKVEITILTHRIPISTPRHRSKPLTRVTVKDNAKKKNDLQLETTQRVNAATYKDNVPEKLQSTSVAIKSKLTTIQGTASLTSATTETVRKPLGRPRVFVDGGSNERKQEDFQYNAWF